MRKTKKVATFLIVALGLLVLPLLLLFGGLLMAADAVYSHLVSAALHFDASALLGHLALTGFLAWLAAGFGRSLLRATAPTRPQEKSTGVPSRGPGGAGA